MLSIVDFHARLSGKRRVEEGGVRYLLGAFVRNG
jgi:hypothetical protein